MSCVGMVVRWDGAPNDPDTLTRITQAAPHRNPPTLHTHQHLTITAHARIDNRHELLPQLQTHLTNPHPTDTQLILAAHQRWGTQTPQHLIGDYAYAIHDTQHHTLHAARDPMGMRPLYYHHTPQRTAITSHPHGLLLSGGVDSGSIAAAAGWAWRRGEVEAPLRAYSWAFEELVEHDERAVSSLITGAYGLPAIAIPADDAWSLAGFPAHGPARDDPYLNPIQPLIDRSLQTAASDGVRTLLTATAATPLPVTSDSTTAAPCARGAGVRSPRSCAARPGQVAHLWP